MPLIFVLSAGADPTECPSPELFFEGLEVFKGCFSRVFETFRRLSDVFWMFFTSFRLCFARYLLTLAAEKGYTEKLHFISLGQGQGPKAEALIKLGAETQDLGLSWKTEVLSCFAWCLALEVEL